jgi:hypothetical protein
MYNAIYAEVDAHISATATAHGATTVRTANTILLRDAAGNAPANGISFPASQSSSADANTLDDYEEGIWNPIISGHTTAGTYELNAATTGYYTKCGRVVHLEAYIMLASSITGGGSGWFKITGLPFTKISGPASVGAVMLSGIDFTASYCVVGFATASVAAYLIVYQIIDAGDFDVLPITAIGANDVISFQINYLSS